MGGRKNPSAQIIGRAINPAGIIRSMKDDSAGAVVLFLGRVRSTNGGRTVIRLEYQTYREMAEKRMREIESELRRRWPVKRVVIVHREGNLPVGEISVAVAVSAEHRDEAFEACRYAMEKIKHTLPIWKREKIAGGKGRWVEGTPIQR